MSDEEHVGTVTFTTAITHRIGHVRMTQFERTSQASCSCGWAGTQFRDYASYPSANEQMRSHLIKSAPAGKGTRQP